MDWDSAIDLVRPHVVRISTPNGYGTGFLTFYNRSGRWCGIATAAHVVDHADEWQQPIRIHHQPSDTTVFLGQGERIILLDRRSDSAVVLCVKGELQLPEVPIPLLPLNEPCSLGADIGWLGYPTIEPYTLCFFAGAVSARLKSRRAYLIDGVAINGVSGGPVFHCAGSDEIQIIGCVSAYHANRATGEALPGLLRAQDVSHFHDAADTIRTWDEAAAKKADFEAAQTTKEVTTAPAPEAGTATAAFASAVNEATRAGGTD
jgi:Trypsin-like peptidase domain